MKRDIGSSNALHFASIDSMVAVRAINSALRRIDERLIDHGERVAYIACEICKVGRLPLDLKTLFLLCIFHDIGAYKTDEIDRMVEFETHDVQNHTIYGYLFLKYLSPLSDAATAILYHHTPWKELCQIEGDFRDYAALIHIADRVDILTHLGADSREAKSLLTNKNDLFCREHVDILQRCLHKNIVPALEDESYRDRNYVMCAGFVPNVSATLEYLKMLVCAIDFRSEYTVTHTVNTVSLAMNVARHFGFDEEQMEKIYLGAMLHDVGKIAIPTDILESSGRLTDDQMDIMRTHVVETQNIIQDIVPDDICNIAIRHHEKLDGSGYPYGLKADELTLPQRIVAVADVVSALSSRRSYKESFPREKTIDILNQMCHTQLDADVCNYVKENYDAILIATEGERNAIISRYQNITREFSELYAQHTA